MINIGKLIILLGVLLIGMGLLVMVFDRVGLGRLPGDIFYQKENFKVYIPVTTSLIVSLILTIILNILIRK